MFLQQYLLSTLQAWLSQIYQFPLGVLGFLLESKGHGCRLLNILYNIQYIIDLISLVLLVIGENEKSWIEGLPGGSVVKTPCF